MLGGLVNGKKIERLEVPKAWGRSLTYGMYALCMHKNWMVGCLMGISMDIMHGKAWASKSMSIGTNQRQKEGMQSMHGMHKKQA